MRIAASMPLSDSRLASGQIGVQHLAVRASPGYLARQGQPKHPSRLDGHDFIVFRNPTSGRERPVQFEVKGKRLDLHPSHRLILDDGEAMVQAARLDIGLTQVPDYMAAEDLARGTLEEVLAGFGPPPLPISVI